MIRFNLQEVAQIRGEALPLLAERYQVGKWLNGGGFGMTYEGHDRTLDRPVAIKELFPQDITERDVDDAGKPLFMVYPTNAHQFAKDCERFRQEGRELGKFKHEGIVQVYDLIETNNTLYLVMEMINGESLEAYLNTKGKPPVEQTLQWMTAIGEALQVMHERNLLHRDIKPANIMLRSDGKPVLIDFGAARSFTQDAPMRMTVVVSEGYAPPEQYDSHGSFGSELDVHALATTTYHLLTGLCPKHALLRKDKEIPSARELCPEVPQHVSDAIRKGMALNTVERYRTIGAFLQAMQSPSDVGSQSPTPTQPQTPRQKSPRKSHSSVPSKSLDIVPKSKVVGVAILVFLTIGGILLFINKPTQPQLSVSPIPPTLPNKPDKNPDNTKLPENENNWDGFVYEIPGKDIIIYVQKIPEDELVRNRIGNYYKFIIIDGRRISLEEAKIRIKNIDRVNDIPKITFKEGEYTLPSEDERLNIAIEHIKKRSKEKGASLFLRGSADSKGGNTFHKMLIDPSFGQMAVFKGRRDADGTRRYGPNKETISIGSPFANKDLPNLRAHFLANKLAIKEVDCQILDGEVTDSQDEPEDRNVQPIIYTEK